MWSKIDNSPEFFEWFLGELEKYVPNYRELVIDAPNAARRGVDNHSIIVAGLPTLTNEQMTYTFTKIREIISIPSNVYLVYDSAIPTYASRYNTKKKRLEIIVPTYAYYHTRY